jgi:catechol 2,3-dioxygenase-like lactoylglutathione lyase family enzyme
VESLIPVLDVRDVDTSTSFYCDVLGFTIQDKVEWAGRTEWALLRAGKVQLMLCASRDHTDDDEQRVNEGIFFLHMDNPDAFILSMVNRNAPLEAQPEAQLGSKDFYLRDPDGYILWFSHRPPVKGTGNNSDDELAPEMTGDSAAADGNVSCKSSNLGSVSTQIKHRTTERIFAHNQDA